MSAFLQDVRYSFRNLLLHPGFAAITIATIALGIGANTAIFSVIHAVLLKPLPYSDPGRLYRVFYSSAAYPHFPMNPSGFLDYRQRNHVFESMGVFTRQDLQLSGYDRPQRLSALRVSPEFFPTLGFRPAIGRNFESRDCIRGNDRVVILSNGLWRREFHGNPAVIGRTITLDSQPFTVIGVMPAGLQHVGGDYRSLPHGESVDAWWPFAFWPDRGFRGSHFLNGIARLKPGVTAAQALAEMNVIAARLGKEHPGTDAGWRIDLVPLQAEIVGSSQRLLMVLLGAVALVLLIACVNVASLLLARSSGRRREFAIRSAIGASHVRLIRQLLTESTLVALAGAALGSLLAAGGVSLLRKFLPPDFPRTQSIAVNLTVLAFTLGVALLTGFLFGLAPAWQASKLDLNRSLRETGQGTTSAARGLRLRSALVIGEVALASLLLIGAGLLLRSFLNLLHLDPGFRPEHVLTAAISLPDARYRTPDQLIHFYGQMTSRLLTLPGVRLAGLGSDLPWTGYDENSGFMIEGRPPSKNDSIHARYHSASAAYFTALGIPLIRGRLFLPSDTYQARKVILINQSLARRYWPNEDPVGKRITFDDHPADKDWMTVAGVVGDVKDTPAAAAAEPAFWWPLTQQPFGDLVLAVRTDSAPATLVSAVRHELSGIDSTLALADIREMDQIAVASVSKPRFALFLVGLFSALAIVLAAIGIYGVMSYSVNLRTSEFGLRMALGGRSRDVLSLVLIQGLRQATAGVVIGLLLAAMTGRFLAALLYGVSSVDPATYAAVAGFALAVACVACLLPAWRAAEVDPMKALRCE